MLCLAIIHLIFFCHLVILRLLLVATRTTKRDIYSYFFTFHISRQSIYIQHMWFFIICFQFNVVLLYHQPNENKFQNSMYRTMGLTLEISILHMNSLCAKSFDRPCKFQSAVLSIMKNSYILS